MGEISSLTIQKWLEKNFGDTKAPPNILFQDIVQTLNKEKSSQLFKELRTRLRQSEKSGDQLSAAYIYLHMAMIFRGQRNYPNAVNMLSKSQTFFETSSDQVGLAALYEELSCVNRELSRNALALEYAQKAIQLYQELNKPLELGWVYDNMAVIFLNMTRRQESINFARKARKIFQEHNNQSCLAWNACNLGNLHQEMGEYNEAERLYLEALDTFRKLDIKQGVAWSLLWLGMLARSRSDFEFAEEHLRLARKAFESLKLIDRAGWAVLNLAGIKWAQGKLKEAEKLNQRALKMFGPIRNNDGLAWGIFQNAQVLRDRGKLTNAWQLVRQAINLYSHIANQKGTGWAECELGEIYWALADQTHARECFAKAKSLAERLELLPLKAEVEKNQANVFIELGYMLAAEKSLESSQLLCQRLNAMEIFGEVLISRIRLALAKADYEAVKNLIQKASKIIEDNSLHRLLPTLKICMGEWLLSTRKIEQALQVFIEAAHQADAQEQRLASIDANLGIIMAVRAMGNSKKTLLRLKDIEKKIRHSGSRKLRAKLLVVEAIFDFELKRLLDIRPLKQAIQILDETGLLLLKKQFLELFQYLFEKDGRMDESNQFKIELEHLSSQANADMSLIASRKPVLEVFPVSILF